MNEKMREWEEYGTTVWETHVGHEFSGLRLQFRCKRVKDIDMMREAAEETLGYELSELGLSWYDAVSPVYRSMCH